MKPTRLLSICLLLVGLLNPSFADTHYVSTNSPTSPYTNWETAAAIIQDAIDMAEAGDTISVTDGVYQAITVDKAIALRSVNGPNVTVIPGLTTNRILSGQTGSVIRGFPLA